MYMLRPYQSPFSATHCGLQCAQMPNLASWYHSGASYCCSDSHVGAYGPEPARPEIGACIGTPSHESTPPGNFGGFPHSVGFHEPASSLIVVIFPSTTAWNVRSDSGIAQYRA